MSDNEYSFSISYNSRVITENSRVFRGQFHPLRVNLGNKKKLHNTYLYSQSFIIFWICGLGIFLCKKSIILFLYDQEGLAEGSKMATRRITVRGKKDLVFTADLIRSRFVREPVIYRIPRIPRGDAEEQPRGRRGVGGGGGRRGGTGRESRRSHLLFPGINFPARVITEQRLLKRNSRWYISMLIFHEACAMTNWSKLIFGLFPCGVDWEYKGVYRDEVYAFGVAWNLLPPPQDLKSSRQPVTDNVC